MRWMSLILMTLVFFSCAERKKKKTVIHKHAYQSPYHYQKSTVKDTVVTLDTNAVEEDTSSRELVLQQTGINQQFEEKETVRKKLHWPSVGSVAAEGAVFGTYAIINQQVQQGLVMSVAMSTLGLLAALLSIGVGFMAFVHFIKFRKEFWGKGFSLFTLYTTALVYLAMTIIGSVILDQLAISLGVLIALTVLVMAGYTYFFYKFVQQLEKE